MNEFLAFNVQTTGKRNPKIVTGSVVSFQGGHVSWSHEYLANPGQAIEPEATAKHGITNEWAIAAGRPHVEVVSLLCGYLSQATRDNIPIVVFDARRDMTVLDHWAHVYDIPYVSDGNLIIIDPLVIDRGLKPEKVYERTLESVAKSYGVEDREVHAATADAQLAGDIWRLMLANHAFLNEISLGYLVTVQRQWYAEWAKPRNLSTDWPIDYALFQLSDVGEN